MSNQVDDIGTSLAANQKKYPRAVHAIERLITLAPMFRNAVADMMHNYGHTFFRRAQARVCEIDFLYGHDSESFDKGIQAYVRFCLEFVRKQRGFLRTGEYSVRDFNDIYSTLYDNDDSMQNFYLVALLFSFVFSSNYYEFYGFFENEFLTNISPAGTVTEIGCGHGLYLVQTLLAKPELKGVGADISTAALGVTHRMLSYHGIDENRYKLSREDLCRRLSYDDNSANAIICCEVLEHLPDPRHALSELVRIIADDGIAMLSAAIRMESVDHLYVFRTYQEVAAMVQEAGFRIRSDHVVPLAKGDLLSQANRQRLIEDPRVPLGYICLAQPA